MYTAYHVNINIRDYSSRSVFHLNNLNCHRCAKSHESLSFTTNVNMLNR
jgi:hypothetical protein